MRYRKLDNDGDYSFGHGAQDFLVNSPATVAQAIQTTLALYQGEWFLDITVGVPWLTEVIGYDTQPLYDTAIKNAVLGVQGVDSIVNYQSDLDSNRRTLTVSMQVKTIYGVVQVVQDIDVATGYGVGGYGERGYGE